MNRRELFYIYPRDKRGKRTGHTICIIQKEGKMFHGVTLCSPNDNFSKAEGRKRAQERALEAYQRHLDKEGAV